MTTATRSHGRVGRDLRQGPAGDARLLGRLDDNGEAFSPDGYFRTGDVGVADGDGFIKIVDRKKDMILVSGFNVFPNEIEAVATACAGVAECACIGVPDSKTGEAVKLFVVKAPAAS